MEHRSGTGGQMPRHLPGVHGRKQSRLTGHRFFSLIVTYELFQSAQVWLTTVAVGAVSFLTPSVTHLLIRRDFAQAGATPHSGCPGDAVLRMRSNEVSDGRGEEGDRTDRDGGEPDFVRFEKVHK